MILVQPDNPKEMDQLMPVDKYLALVGEKA
jgi:hypothetical protein